MVQQAVGYLANEPVSGVMPALEKIDAALAAPDQDGVSVADVQRAKSELQAGKVAQGRALLQASIAAALSTVKPATGDQTGTTVVLDALPSRSGLTGEDWGFLALSVLAILGGLLLAYLFRPHQSVRELRTLLRWKHRGPNLPPKHEQSRGRKQADQP